MWKLAEYEDLKKERDVLHERAENNGTAAHILTDLISKRHVM